MAFGISAGTYLLAGSALAGSAIAGNASKNAAQTQSNAANNAAQMQQNQFNTINQQQAPYRQAGYGGLSKLSYLLGIGGQNGATYDANGNPQGAGFVDLQKLAYDPGFQSYLAKTGYTPEQWLASANQEAAAGHYGNDAATQAATMNAQFKNAGITADANQYLLPQTDPNAATSSAAGSATDGGYGSLLHQFGTADLATNLSPSYQFMLDQGRGALENANARSGGLLSGNALQGLNKFAQDYASTGYQQAYNNYNTNQKNIYDRLSGIAGIGQSANNTTANAGLQTASNAGNYLVGGANATAAGQVGTANAINNGLSQAAGWGYLSNQQPNYGTGGGGNVAGGLVLG